MESWKVKPCLVEDALKRLADFAVDARGDAVGGIPPPSLPRPGGARPNPVPARSRPRPPPGSFLGTEVSAIAPVEETICFSSMVTPGSGATSEPVAMMICLAVRLRTLPSAPFTSTLPGAVMRASPTMASDLAFFEQEFHALGQLADHLGLLRHHLGQIEIDLGLDAQLGEIFLGLVKAFAGMQQRLGRDAADIQAGAAEGAALVDTGRTSGPVGPAGSPHCSRRAALDHDCVETVRHGPALLIFEPGT